MKRESPGTARSKGRPAKYTAPLATAICEAVEDGASLRRACVAAGVRYATAQGWLKSKPAFADRYARACEIRLSLLEDRITELLEDLEKAAFDPENGMRLIQAIKIEIDAVKWQLCKLIPRRYGNAAQMELEIKDPSAVLPHHTTEQDAAFLAMLAEIQAKTPPPDALEYTA